MIDSSIEQRSVGWFRERLGCVTGSRCSELMGKGRGKDAEWSQTALTYIYQLAGERMFNPAFLEDDEVFQDYIDTTSHTTKAMQWGVEQEEAAKSLFMQIEFADGESELSEVSSCKHNTIDWFAASPDGIVLDRRDGKMKVLEVKCPSVATYMKYRSQIKDAESLKSVESKYFYQMMAEMACTGTEMGFFVVYQPWLSSPIHIARIERDDETVKELEERVVKANTIIDEILKN